MHLLNEALHHAALGDINGSGGDTEFLGNQFRSMKWSQKTEPKGK
jgi:hypothetical protein